MTMSNRFKIGLCSTFVLGLIYLNISINYGRLSHDVAWDDIVYVATAFKRVDILMKSGLYDFFLSWGNPVPHSIYSEATAVVSIILFGLNDFGFYATNLIPLISTYIFLYFTFKNTEQFAFLLIFAFAMCSPIPYVLIENFRPDLVLGLATTAMAWWILRAIIFGQHRDLLWGGLAFAAALLIKPTFFAHTMAVASGLSILGIAVELHKGMTDQEYQPTPLQALKYLLLGLLIASPYYIAANQQIWTHFWVNTRGAQAHLWSFSEELSSYQVLLTYINNGYLKHGGMLVPAASIVTLVLCPTLYIYGKQREAIMAALLLIIATCSFAVMVFGRHKNEFFFSSFHMLTILSAIYSISVASLVLKGKKKNALYFAAAATLILTTSQNYKFLKTDNRQENLRSQSENKSIATQITTKLAGEGRGLDYFGERPKVYFPFTGPVASITVEWEARKLGFFISTEDNYRSDNLSEHIEAKRRAEFVVIPYSMNAQYDSAFPSSSIQHEFAIRLLSDPEFRVLSPRSPTDHYIVFERIRSVSERVLDIETPGNHTGFGSEEGPYPQWDLPRVAWMSSPVANVCLYEPGRYQVALEARSETDASVEVLSLKGVPLANDIFNANQFQSLAFSQTFTLNDPCISIRYGTLTQSPREGNYLLFRKLKISKITGE